MSHFERVQSIIAEALYLEPSAVTRDSSLVNDLGAESIDFLDIVFRLEKEFGVKLSRGEIERRAKGELSDDEFAKDGRLSSQALEQLKQAMPEVDATVFARGELMVRDIPRLFTVATFERMVLEQLFGGGKEAPAANAAAAASPA